MVRKELVDLPQEIISDILSRLPIESILTCRIVCRSWYNLSRDPDFVNLQLSRSINQSTRFIIRPQPQRDHLLLLDAEYNIKRIPIERTLLKDRLIVCSCNGLLCMTTRIKLDPMVIYNPMTRQRMILPPLDCKVKIRNPEAGLGFDLSTGRYKVVRVYKKGRSESSRFEILSLGESSWRELSAPRSLLDWDWDGCGSLFWNGVLYWKMMKTSQGYYNISILAFDVSEEKFQMIYFPKNFLPPCSFFDFDLLDLDGRLTLVEHHVGIMKIWRLSGKKVGDFSLCLDQIYDTHVAWNDRFSCRVIGGLNNNGYLLCVSIWQDLDQPQKSYITRYFPQTAEYWQLDIPGTTEFLNIYAFKPSLVSPVAASLLP